MKNKAIDINKTIWIVFGTVFILLSFVMLGVGVWEGINSVRKNYFQIQLPGFHELELDSAGLYAGVYQYQGSVPVPRDVLSQLEIRIFSKGDFQEVPVYSTPVGQPVTRLGQSVVPVFSFAVDRPGGYTMSGFYMGEGEVNPIPIIIFAQAARNIKQTLVVAGVFFLIFLILGIYMCIKGVKASSARTLRS